MLVTRPRGRAAGLAARIEGAGGRAHLFPVIEIQPLADLSRAREALARLTGFDLVIFVSPSAVQQAFALFERWPDGLRAAGVGAGTRAELELRGLRDVLTPSVGADSEALLALPELGAMRDRRVLIVRGEGGREVLRDALAARGARVEQAPCYRRVRPAADPAPLLAAWEAGRVDAATVSSAEGLANLLAMLGERGRALVQRTPLFVSHERVAGMARDLGAQDVHVAGAGDGEVLARLVAYFQQP